MTRLEFIEKAKKVHGDKYDYSKVEYINIHTKVCIICPTHGEFWQVPMSHLKGCGCKKCVGLDKPSTEEFIDKVRKIHGDKYDYSKVEYVNNRVKIIINCKEHGEFFQAPKAHLKGQGCPLCRNKNNAIKRSLGTQIFIEKAIQIHGDKYDYSKVEYINTDTKVCIICKEHGEFWQRPHEHLSGKGCPKCSFSHLENQILKLCNEENIEFVPQKKFDFLNRKVLDFYLPKYNIAIECQGTQHFFKNHFFGDEMTLNEQINRDIKKYNLCKENNIKILYLIENKYKSINLSDEKFGGIYNETNVFYNIEDLKKYITI